MSFSTYWRGRKCPGAAIPAKCISSANLVGPGDIKRHVLLGRFFHDLVKATANSERRDREPKEVVEDAFWSVAREFATRFPNLELEYEPRVQDIYDTVNRRVDFKFGYPRELLVETELVSMDQLLFGIPDWVMITDEDVELVDFKLSTTPEGLRSEKNIAQLAFYAHLVEEVFGRYPTRIRLIGLNGVETEVQVSRDAACQLTHNAREMLDVFLEAKRGHLPLEQIATPSESACSNCRYSHICERAIS